MSLTYEIRKGAYYDSVVLMQLQRSLAGLDGVEDAGIVMATPANLDLLESTNLLPSATRKANADDLLIVVKGETEAAATAAINQLDDLLAQRRKSSSTQSFTPRSLANAAGMLPPAQWVLISVPGRYAAGVADEALDLGKHVFLYSDNVTLAAEKRLKEKAQSKGLMVMGPDCGTAIINGIGLGFANHVRKGHIGLVGASGTGLQAITSAIHSFGAGITHALGTGGRDLKEEIAGITALQSLELLGRDGKTDIIILISKPPAPSVATKLAQAAQATGKPVFIYFMGQAVTQSNQNGNLIFTNSLLETAMQATEWSLYGPHGAYNPRSAVIDQPAAGYLRGLFSGGTLAYEMLLFLRPELSPLYSNINLPGVTILADVNRSQAHTLVDLGGDEFTQGRLHPMMDNDLRIRRLQQEAADNKVGFILLDLVLGEGAHPDPASELAPVIAAAKNAGTLDIGVIVIGTDEDPQDKSAQEAMLAEAGAIIFTSVNEAAAYLLDRLSVPAMPAFPPVSLPAIQNPMAAINVGLESFADSLISQGAEVVHVDWRPPAGGNEKMMALLAKMKKKS